MCVFGTARPRSSSSAFKYFSAHCWQWKQTPSCRRFLALASSRAASRSASAFITHSAVNLFIQHFPSLDDFAQKRIAFLEPPLHRLGRPDVDIQRKRRVNRQADAHRLIKFIPGRHDDENIHIAVGMRLAIGMGTEKDDLLRLKPFRDLPGELPNDAHRHVGPAIRTSGPRRMGGLDFSHVRIVQQKFTGCKTRRGSRKLRQSLGKSNLTGIERRVLCHCRRQRQADETSSAKSLSAISSDDNSVPNSPKIRSCRRPVDGSSAAGRKWSATARRVPCRPAGDAACQTGTGEEVIPGAVSDPDKASALFAAAQLAPSLKRLAVGDAKNSNPSPSAPSNGFATLRKTLAGAIATLPSAAVQAYPPARGSTGSMSSTAA